jgi:PAS domain S-box-containing protein
MTAPAPLRGPEQRAATLPTAAAPAEWGALLDAMLHAVWLVDAHTLCIVGVNAAARRLHGGADGELLHRPVLEFAVTPEDQAFWQEAGAASARSIESETLVRRADGSTLPVLRRVSALPAPAGRALYVVALADQSGAARREAALELENVELRATLDSLGDGILVTDLRGRIRNFNRRFADLWELPEELVARHADADVLDWMERSVIDPARYLHRLATLDGATMLRASDVLALQSGRLVERLTVPQCSQGRPIGRVYVFRELDRPRRDAVPAHA